MKLIVPISLLSLPEPWRNMKVDVEEGLVVNDETLATALQVLDRCLQAVEELPDVSPDDFPDFIIDAWSLWASSFETLMPSFDEFRMETMAEAFRKQDPDITDAFVLRYAQAWLRKQALSRAEDAKIWLFYSLRVSPHAETLDDLRSTIERHWRADQGLAFSLLFNLWVLDRPGSTVLLEKVAAAPDAPAELATEMKQLLAR